MSHSRVSALLASSAVMLSTIVGITFTPAAASAHPVVHYPPPPPSLVVNHGVVKRGDNVRATGHKFRARERVRIVVSKGSRTLRSSTAYANLGGNFTFTVRMTTVGLIVIKATGQTSHKWARVTVRVVDRRW